MVRCYDYCNLLWPSSGHGCAAVDPGINILLLPPAVLHNKSDKFTTGQSTVWDRNNETDKGSFKLQTWIRNDAMVNSAFFLMASLTLLAIKASQHDAYLIWALGFLEIVYLSEPKLSQAKGKRKTANFFNTLQWSKAEVMDICHTLLDLERSGVGFLDLAIVLRVVWKVGATPNIISRWKHPIQVWKSWATCMCLPKDKAKEHGHWHKTLAKAFDD